MCYTNLRKIRKSEVSFLAKYNTKQRASLLRYLADHADETLCGRQIAEALAPEGVSLSAVYRNLSALEAEGKVRRISREGSRQAYFRYADSDECRGHIHLSCVSCGRTYHLDGGCSDALIDSVARSSDFEIDRADTVLRGVCGSCRGKTPPGADAEK